MIQKNIFIRLLFASLCFWYTEARGQDTCTFLFTIPGNVQFVTGDHLNNTYLLRGFEVEKYDSTGKQVARYSNNRLGKAGFVDASNPLKILVWYADFQTAVFLDRNMTELGRLNVAQAGFPAVRCLASAADGNLWAYDEATSFLLKLSTSGEKQLESQPLNLAFSQRFAPTCIRDDGGQTVFLSDPLQGLAVFDPFAQLDRILLIKDLTQFEVEGGILFSTGKESIRIENWRGLSAKNIPFPAAVNSENTRYWIAKRRLFILRNLVLEVYGF